MRVVIDRDKLTFLPIKHPDLFVCANLAWIECWPGQQYHIDSMDASFLKGFGDLDLMILYKHTTGETATCYGNKLRNVLRELAERIPVRECNPFEVDRQAMVVPEIRGERYLYQPGSMQPLIQGNLFKLAPVTLAKASNEKEIAERAAPVAPSAPPRVPATPAPPNPAAPRAAPASVPRQANVAGVVWAVADALWEAAGKPTDTKIVLTLRRTIMDELEQKHGVKRVSASNELGKWQKTKI